MSHRKTWRCFHCDTVFLNPKHAAEHFGRDETSTPACKLTHSEGHLITYIRKLEAENHQHRLEDSDVLRAMHAAEAEWREKSATTRRTCTTSTTSGTRPNPRRRG